MFSGLLAGLLAAELVMRTAEFAYLSSQRYRNNKALVQKDACLILCLGESTTALGGEKSYPAQLEDILNSRKSEMKFSVINRGMPGTNTEHILENLENNLKKFRPDIVITMMGINDSSRLHRPYKRNFFIFFTRSKTYKLILHIRLHLKSKLESRKFPSDSSASKRLRADPNDHPRKTHLPDGPALAEKYFHSGEYENCVSVLEKNLKNEPGNIESLHMLAKCHFELGNREAGLNSYGAIIKLNPDLSDGYLWLGTHYYFEKNYQKAEELWLKALALDPDNPDICYCLGLVYLDSSSYDKAEKMMRRAVHLNPDDDFHCSSLAALFEEQKKMRRAEAFYRMAEKMRFSRYNPITKKNYLKLADILAAEKIRLVCVQYPRRSITPLKKMLSSRKDIIFVDNENLFKEAARKEGYGEYFSDRFAGDFGHCTDKGNRLLANNIAETILKNVGKLNIKQTIGSRRKDNMLPENQVSEKAE